MDIMVLSVLQARLRERKHPWLNLEFWSPEFDADAAPTHRIYYEEDTQLHSVVDMILAQAMNLFCPRHRYHTIVRIDTHCIDSGDE